MKKSKSFLRLVFMRIGTGRAGPPAASPLYDSVGGDDPFNLMIN